MGCLYCGSSVYVQVAHPGFIFRNGCSITNKTWGSRSGPPATELHFPAKNISDAESRKNNNNLWKFKTFYKSMYSIDFQRTTVICAGWQDGLLLVDVQREKIPRSGEKVIVSLGYLAWCRRNLHAEGRAKCNQAHGTCGQLYLELWGSWLQREAVTPLSNDSKSESVPSINSLLVLSVCFHKESKTSKEFFSSVSGSVFLSNNPEAC